MLEHSIQNPFLKCKSLKSPASSYASPANNRYCVDTGCFPEQTLWKLDIKIEAFISFACHHKLTQLPDRHVCNVSVTTHSVQNLAFSKAVSGVFPLDGCTTEGSKPIYSLDMLWQASCSCLLAADGWRRSKMYKKTGERMQTKQSK